MHKPQHFPPKVRQVIEPSNRPASQTLTFAGSPIGWIVEPLGALTDDRGISYGVVQPGSYVEDGIPMLRVNNIQDGRISGNDILRIAPEIEAKHARTRLRGGEVLLTLVGSLGNCAVVPPELTGWNVARAVGVISVRNSIDPRWVAICLRSAPVQQRIRDWATTTVQATLNLRDVSKLPILVPPQAEREAITELLSTLDDKIALNRQMNQTLEHIAATLFKSWFVDFDPVRAKAEGRQPQGMDAETAALFPDRLVESEIGEIPEGWSIVPVGEVVTAVGGSTPSTAQSDYWGGDIPFATPKDLSKLDAPVLLTTERHITEAGLARISSGLIPRHSLLMSSRAPIGYLTVNEVPVSVNQGMIVMVCDKGVSPWFMLGWARANMEEIVGRANGTTFLEISKRNFRPIPVVLPPRPLLERFDAAVGPLFARLTSNLKQNRTLDALRDLLLSKLLSGELRVPTDVLNEEPIAMPQPSDQPLVQSAF